MKKEYKEVIVFYITFLIIGFLFMYLASEYYKNDNDIRVVFCFGYYGGLVFDIIYQKFIKKIMR